MSLGSAHRVAELLWPGLKVGQVSQDPTERPLEPTGQIACHPHFNTSGPTAWHLLRISDLQSYTSSELMGLWPGTPSEPAIYSLVLL